MLILASFALAAPREEVLALARTAHACATKAGVVSSDLVTIIDYERPSTEPRLAIVDQRSGQVRLETRVAHGRASGEDRAVSFSNVDGTNQSSLGVFVTGDVLDGKHGRSLLLHGLDPGWNDHARRREIVMHGADYVTDAFVARWGRLGRSHGCPALDPAITDRVIELIKGGTLIFAYAPDPEWLASSTWLTCAR